MPSLDTNCILRWLLGDIPEQTALITDLIDSEKKYAVADAALIETVFVLEKVKKISRETVNKAILAVIEKDSILCNKELFMEILPVYSSHPKLSFVDCYLEALARKSGNTPLLTFDQKVANQLSGTKLLSS
ncbi:MAG: PIN domain-containing protein [Treponema sp.]|nr:PIN domain-containing protein [Treponema sp.]